jgi:hypothetical protein
MALQPGTVRDWRFFLPRLPPSPQTDSLSEMRRVADFRFALPAKIPAMPYLTERNVALERLQGRSWCNRHLLTPAMRGSCR